MKSMFGYIKALQTVMPVPFLQVVKTFNGHDGTDFKQWVKDIERYAQMASLNDADIPTYHVYEPCGRFSLKIPWLV